MLRTLSLASLLLVLCLPVRAGAQTVTIYTNVNFAPLVIDADTGLYPELVAYLNRQKIDTLTFRLEQLPRKRMQVMLDDQTLDGAIIGMMPQWFGDDAQTRYLWTMPFFRDRFVLVSPARAPLNYDPGALLASSRLGVTLGYVYPGVDEWVARTKMIRSDAPSEEKNLEKLLLGRLDAVIIAESVLRHYLKTRAVTLKLHISALPGQQTERRFLVPRTQLALYERLAPAIRKLQDDPAWQAIRARYE